MSNLWLNKFLGKIRTVFGDINTQLLILTIRRTIKGVYIYIKSQSIDCRFFEGVRFQAQRKDGANISRIWSHQRNCYRYNDAQQKMKAMVRLPRGNRFLWYGCWGLARIYINRISIYDLPKNVNRSNKRKWYHSKKKKKKKKRKRQDANDILQKLSRMKTTQMI